MKRVIIMFDSSDDKSDNSLLEIVKQRHADASIQSIEKSCKTCNTECCGGLAEACSRWSHIIK